MPDSIHVLAPAARVLAIDLGKYTSVACDYCTSDGKHTFTKIKTCPQAFHDMIVERTPDRVVVEIGSAAGWVRDMCEALDVPLQIANPNHEAWRWKNVKRKTDRDDALKLARLSAVGQLPAARVRQWRSLILYRTKLVGRRTMVKNSIRSLLDRQGLSMPAGRKSWTAESLKALSTQAKPLASCDPEELWRGQLEIDLTAYAQVQELIDQVEAKLDALAAQNESVQRLQTIPGVGPRLSELLVAVIDDPKRFKSRKQVGAYIGLVPRQFESGTMERQGRITRSGHRLLRCLLVEVSWLMRQYNPELRHIFDQVCRGNKSRRKIAAVATARRLLVICWAMLRDRTEWSPPRQLAA